MPIYSFTVKLTNHGAPHPITIETDEEYSVARRFALEAVGSLVEGGWPVSIEPGYTPDVQLIGYHVVAASPTPPA